MLEESYKKLRRKKDLYILAAFVLTLLCGYLFTTLGMKNVGLDQTLIALQRYFEGTLNQGADVATNKIILLLRMPRIALAILAGIGLAVSGAAMQSITRNYLVSPFTLGISSAAAFGASICIVFGTGLFFQTELAIIGSAFIASCGCGLIVYGISQQLGVKPSSLVLVGIALNYLFSAMTATIEFFAKEHKLESVVQWTFGSFNRATWEGVAITAVILVLCCCILMSYCLQLNAMSSNDDEMVRSLGVDAEKLRTIVGLLAILMTATVISFTGVIGFVGLIAPHMARIIIGNDHRFYLPFAAALGSLLLLLSDTIGKFILYPVNIPVGIVISFLGVPLFVHLILSRGKGLE